MRIGIAVVLFVGLLAGSQLAAKTPASQTTKESVYGKLNAILAQVQALPDEDRMTELLRKELYPLQQQVELLAKEVDSLNREIRDMSRDLDNVQRDIKRQNR